MPKLLERPLVWSLLVLALNLVLRGLYLGNPDIGLDEPFTLFRAQKSYGELIADLAQNNHPPLFESMVWVWLRVVGFHKEALRLLPMALSTCAALALLHTGRKHFSLFAGVIAALLFTFSNYHFYLSHELRSYPLFALVTALSLHLYFNLLNNERPPKRDWLLQGAWGALLLYTHYFGAFVILAQVLHSLFILRKKEFVLAQIKAGLFTAVLYVPQVYMVLNRWVDKVEGGHWLGRPSVQELFNVLSKFMNAPVLTVLALLIGIVGLYLARNKNYAGKTKALIMLFPGMFLAMWIVAQALPIFQDRYISFTMVGWFLVTGLALDQFPKWIKLGAAALLVLTMAITVKYRPYNGQWTKEMVALVKEEKQEDTDVFIYPHWSVACFSYHYNLEHFSNYQGTEELFKKENIHFIHSSHDPLIEERINQGRKVILINFEGPIASRAAEFENVDVRVEEKDRQGVAIVEPKKAED